MRLSCFSKCSFTIRISTTSVGRYSVGTRHCFHLHLSKTTKESSSGVSSSPGSTLLEGKNKMSNTQTPSSKQSASSRCCMSTACQSTPGGDISIQSHSSGKFEIMLTLDFNFLSPVHGKF